MNNFISMNTRLEMKNQYINNNSQIINNRNDEDLKIFKPTNNIFLDFNERVNENGLNDLNDTYIEKNKNNFINNDSFKSPFLHERNIISTRLDDNDNNISTNLNTDKVSKTNSDTKITIKNINNSKKKNDLSSEILLKNNKLYFNELSKEKKKIETQKNDLSVIINSIELKKKKLKE